MNSDRKIYFISDAHVGSSDREAEILKENKLRSFFQYLQVIDPPPILYIVGDLFDFWFEYRFAIPAIYQKLLSHLVQLTDRGILIRYVTGNHDYWMGKFFPKNLGIEVYHGVHILHCNHKIFYIFHGDGVLEEDKGYRFLKRIIQSPLIIKTYQWIHPDIGIPIARWASAMSRNHYGKDPETEKLDDQKYLQYAMEILKGNYDFILMGHTHRPVIARKGEKIYVNLGDWIRHFTFATYGEDGLRLFQWHDEFADRETRYEELAPVQIEGSGNNPGFTQ